MKFFTMAVSSLISFSTFATITPCGQFGAVESRIRNCSALDKSPRDNFRLVTRDKDGLETYQDVKTELLWSDKLPESVKYDQAVADCKALPAVKGHKWSMPSLEQFKEAKANGMATGLPNTKFNFWTSSWVNGGVSDFGPYVFVFDAHSEYVDYAKIYLSGYHTRCVAGVAQ